MKFYIGLHHTTLAKHFESSFISINILRNRKSGFEVNDWIMDSGAFTEISNFGEFRFPVSEYAEQIDKWAENGNMELAVAQDYMCESFILSKTGLSIKEHQRLTIDRYDKLIGLTSVPIMPVLQGYEFIDYIEHLKMYGDRLKPEMRVGVGSICKRNKNPMEIVRILHSIKLSRSDLRLHGFGIKKTSLMNQYVQHLLYSADSMAWSFTARREGRNANSLIEATNFLKELERTTGTKAAQLELIMGAH